MGSGEGLGPAVSHFSRPQGGLRVARGRTCSPSRAASDRPQGSGQPRPKVQRRGPPSLAGDRPHRKSLQDGSLSPTPGANTTRFVCPLRGDGRAEPGSSPEWVT